MSDDCGEVVKLLTTKKALKLTGYRAMNSLMQLHREPTIKITCYKVHGGPGQGAVMQAWSEKELRKFIKEHGNHHLTEEKWLID